MGDQNQVNIKKIETDQVKKSAVELSDDEQSLELIAIEDGPILIEDEPPRKKRKQSKMTSFLCKLKPTWPKCIPGRK